MTTSPTGVAKAWSRSKARSPLLRAWRWAALQAHRQAFANRVIRDAELPEPVAARIESITRRTRLWPTERAEIARELCAHAHDALDSGRDTASTLSALGDPKTVAKLLRRSAKRKRHWLWQIRHRTSQAILTTLAATFLFYTALFVRFNTGVPSIKRNYIAELNDRNAAYTEDQNAWPAIEALWIEWNKENRRLNAIQAAQREAAIRESNDPATAANNPPTWAFDMREHAAPEHVGYDEYLEFLARIEPQLDAATRAAHLPAMGGLYSDRSEEIPVDGADFTLSRPHPPHRNTEESGSLIGVLLPWLGQTRAASNILLADAGLAARETDAARATDRLEASALYAGHMADERFLIASLVGIAIQQHTEQTFLRMLRDQPGFFSDRQLARLSHRLSASAERCQNIDMTLERHMFYDVLQRTFTDDGTGDGRLTASGFQELGSEIFSFGDGNIANYLFDGSTPPTTLRRIVGPASLLAVASRAEHRQMYDRLIGIVELACDPEMPTADAMARTAEFNTAFTKHIENTDRFPAIRLLMPGIGKCIQTAHIGRAHTDATLLAIAAHLHHRQTGAWPTDAAQLVPRFLPSLPEDPFNPGHSFQLQVRDGRLIVYSVGADADDDGGTEDPDQTGHPDTRGIQALYMRYPTSRPDAPNGDWIIYPPAD